MNKKKKEEVNNNEVELGYFGKLPSGLFSKYFITDLISLLDGLSLVMLLCSSFFKQWILMDTMDTYGYKELEVVVQEIAKRTNMNMHFDKCLTFMENTWKDYKGHRLGGWLYGLSRKECLKPLTGGIDFYYSMLSKCPYNIEDETYLKHRDVWTIEPLTRETDVDVRDFEGMKEKIGIGFVPEDEMANTFELELNTDFEGDRMWKEKYYDTKSRYFEYGKKFKDIWEDVKHGKNLHFKRYVDLLKRHVLTRKVVSDEGDSAKNVYYFTGTAKEQYNALMTAYCNNNALKEVPELEHCLYGDVKCYMSMWSDGNVSSEIKKLKEGKRVLEQEVKNLKNHLTKVAGAFWNNAYVKERKCFICNEVFTSTGAEYNQHWYQCCRAKRQDDDEEEQ
tara:strand:- start:2729 stop:3901 length:1173 start_codon:yes stop_codon:yes gene_type:complete